MKYAARLCSYVRPYTRLAATSLFVMLVSGVVALAVPWPLKVLIDNVFAGAPLSGMSSKLLGAFASSRVTLLIVIVLAGLLLSLLENALSVIANYVNTRLEQQVV